MRKMVSRFGVKYNPRCYPSVVVGLRSPIPNYTREGMRRRVA